MTDLELNKIMAVLSAAFPAFSRGMSDSDARAVMELWRRHIGHLPYDGVMAALNAVIDTRTEGYPPTIGLIKEHYRRLSTPALPDAETAWNTVFLALRNCGYHAKEEFSRLPPEIQKTVGSPEVLHSWAMMDTQELNTFVAASFMRSYRAQTQTRTENALLSPEVREYASLHAACTPCENECLSLPEKTSPVTEAYL